MAQLPRTIRTGLSRRFINKPTGQYDAGAHKTFPTAEISPEELARHITAGYAFAVARYKDGHRKKANFIDGQLLALDLDNGPGVDETAAHPFVAAYAYLVYPTPSSTPESPRTRVVFVLEEAVLVCGRFEALQRAVIAACADLQPDTAAADGARQFYGSNQPGWRILGNVLPVQVAGALLVDEALAEDAMKALPAPVITPLYGAEADEAFDNRRARALEMLAAAGAGNHHNAARVAGFSLGVLAKYPAFNQAALEADARRIIDGWPDRADHWRTFQDGLRSGIAKAEPPQRKERPPRSNKVKRSNRGQAKNGAPTDSGTTGAYPDIHNQRARDFVAINADRTIDAEYVSAADLLSAPAVALRSGVGTGKTTAIIEVFRRAAGDARRAVYLSHREQLTGDFVNKAARAGVYVHHYKDVAERDQLAGRSRLAICINTYAHLGQPAGLRRYNAPGDAADGLPSYDTVVIDEVDQMLNHLYLPNDTMSAAEQPYAAEALAYVIRKARQVIAVDATISAAGIAYLRMLRPDLQVVDNVRRPQRGTLILHDNRAETIDALRGHLEALKDTDPPIAVAMASKEKAVDLAEELAPIAGAGRLLLLSADNKGEPAQAAFLRDPNVQTGLYRLIIYTPVIGTGYDVTAPVSAVYALIDGQHCSAEDARQLIGRFRRAPIVHVWMPRNDPDGANPDELEAEAIESRLYALARRSGQLVVTGIDTNGKPTYNPMHQRYVAEYARRQSRKNFSRAYMRQVFAALAAEYTITERNGRPDPAAAALRRQMAEERTARLKALTLEVEAVDDWTYAEAKRAGVITETMAAGHRRWQIERTSRQAINANLRDTLWTSRARAALRSFTDLLTDRARVVLIDAKEATQTSPNETPQDRAARERLFAGIEGQTDVPIHRRQYRALKRDIGQAALAIVTGPDGMPLAEMARAELEPLAESFAAQFGEDLRLIKKWAHTRVPNAIAQLRAALALEGVRLQYKSARVANAVQTVWFVDAEAYQAWCRLRETRNAALDQEYAEAVSKSQGEAFNRAPANSLHAAPTPAKRLQTAVSEAAEDYLAILTAPTILTSRRPTYAAR